MKKLIFSVILLTCLILTTSIVKAEPSNNPVFATLEKVQELIQQAIFPLQEDITNISSRLTKLEAIVTPIPEQITQLQEEVDSYETALSSLQERVNLLENPPIPTPTPEPGYFFDEEFDGSGLDQEKWEDYSNGGNILVNNGLITLSANSPSKFPFVQTKNNPFPSNNNFILTWRMRYLQLNNSGTGFAFGQGQQNPNTYCSVHYNSNGMHSGCNELGGLWGGNSSYLGLYTQPTVNNIVNALEWHNYSLDCQYFPGQVNCSMYVDQNKITQFSNPDINMPIPSNIWFGHPDYSASSTWSSFQIDYIRVNVF